MKTIGLTFPKAAEKPQPPKEVKKEQEKKTAKK